MGEFVARKVEQQRPSISVPPRSSFESFLSGLSPGPLTLVSSFLSDPDSCSFSQLLAGAMASPVNKPSGFSFFAQENDVDVGFDRNRPGGLVVAQSPVFMVPPGLSPSGLLNSPGFLSPLQSPFGMSHQQALAHVTAQAALSQSYEQVPDDFQQSLASPPTEALQDQSCSLADENLLCNSVGTVTQSETVRIESPEICQSDRKGVVASVEKLEYDGYNWRKYGQKQVKASEYPRSYYKCTHVGCPVKKKVERSGDGHVTEITYKGQHNHDPLTNKRAKDSSRPVRKSSSNVNPQPTSQDQTGSISYTPTFLSLEDGQSQPSSQQKPVTSEHDRSQDNTAVNEDDDNDQSNAKRRCMEEAGASGHTSTHKTVTESRIIVQTRSEVDLLDDGYKWRKYGQKVVKGNPYPRSYYRCTHAECNVRKQVERASTDPKNVITTYEGKHNHVIPAAKNSGSNAPRSINAVQLKSENMNARKPTLHTGMDFESKDQIPVLSRVTEGEIAA
ncbi:hypothetical protein Leryth_019530 [Lithospermum erythrorhizon]|nr:hypothetical protein Leryth_019530 [Lithospermum erythrorhizon]